jgi:signal peptidase II
VKRGLPLWLGLALAVIVIDQATKAWIMSLFRVGEALYVAPYFNLVLVFNAGASFSFLADAGGWQRWFFIALALGVSIWLLLMIRHHATERLMPAALALVLGGALGNVIDRIRFGAVADFLQFHYSGWYFPAFNAADSAITVGIALMLFDQLTHRDQP